MDKFKCNVCDGIGFRQNCNEHRKVHGHGMVHLQKIFKADSRAWWLCNACSEREQ